MVQSNSAHALARDELVRVLTAYSGVTTADGNLLGTSLIDSNLVGKNDFLTGKTILIMSGDAVNEDRGGQSFNPATGEVTVPSAYTDKNGNPVQIPAGTLWRVLNISSVEINVADLEALMGTPADPPGTTTVFAWLSKIFSNTSFFADLIEGVYLDTSGGGTPGTTYPIGSAGVPSSNLTDAFAIMATRHSNQLRLVGGSTDAPVTLTFTTPVDIELVGGQGYAVVFNHGGLTSDIKGDVTVASLTVTDGSLTIRGNCHAVFVQNDGTGDVLIEESCFSSNGGVANGGSGNIRVEIDCHCEGVSINNSGAGIIMIDGDVYGGVINDGTNMILIGGNVFAEVSAIQCTSTGSIQIDGDVHVHYAVIDPGPSSSIFIGGDCDAARSGIQSDGTSSIIICGRCQADNISNNGTGLTRIYGDTSVLNGDVHNFSTGLIEMFADCFINGGITNESAGTIEIMGNSRAQSVSNNGNNGNIHIHGDMYMNDSATLLNGGGGTAAISVDGDFFGSNTAIENDLEGSIGIGGDCFAREIDNVSTGVAGGISIGGNTFVGIGVNDSSTGGFTYFGGSVDSSSGIVVNGSGSLTVSRNCTTSTLVQGGAGGSIIVRGDLEVPF